ncbi:FERM domain-containing protein 6 isoform X2 [Sander vitreus]
MSTSIKQERTICVLLPNKDQLDITVGPKPTGQDVFNRMAELLGIKELHFFGLTVVRENEHIFLDMEEKLTKYFPKEWKQDSGKGLPKRPLPIVLCLKVQYYIENGRLICERKARHLYYSDLRERVLRSECRQQEEVYFQLAGYALQADLGDHPLPRQDMEVAPYFEPKEYFPPWIVAKRGVNYLHCHGPKVHQELWGMSTRDAMLLFIRESCQLEDVPVTFYKLQKDKKAERGTALLGLTLRGMQVYQEVNNTRQLLYDFPWSNVGRLTFLGKKFEIQPDGLPSARKLVYYTGSSFRSRHLLLHLSSSHRLYLSLQPALKHLRQLEESKDKKRYRESYISDDLDLGPTGSESSPGLSRHSTSSSGIEADARQRSISTEMASMEEEGQRQAEKCFSSVASHSSSCTSGFDIGSKAPIEDEGWQEEDKEWFKNPMKNRGRDEVTLPGGSPGPPSGARPRWRARQRASGGRVCHGARSGTARKSYVADIPPSHGPTTCGRNRWGRVRCHMGGSEGQGPRRTRPGQQRLALGTWNVTSLWGKEPELVREVERYRLDLVGLTSTHSLGSGTILLDRGWTYFFSRV